MGHTLQQPLSLIRVALIAPIVLGLGLGPGCDSGQPPETSDQGVAAVTGEGLVVLNPQNAERPTFYDLGKVPLGDVAERRLRLLNREGRAVVIRDAIPSCGCTTVSARFENPAGEEIERRLGQGTEPFELAPGAEFELILRVDTSIVPAANAPKLLNVRLRNNSDSVPYLTFELTLIVHKPFEIVPSRLSLGAIPENGDASGSVKVVCFDPQGFEVTGVQSAPQRFDIQLEQRFDNLRPTWELTLHVPPPNELGTLRESITLSTSGAGGQGVGKPLIIPVHGEVCADVAASPSRLQFPAFASTEGAQARVELKALLSGLRTSITAARAVGEHADQLQLSWEPRDPDSEGRATRFQIDLTAPAGLPVGSFRGDIVVSLDSTGVPKVLIPYGGSVRGR